MQPVYPVMHDSLNTSSVSTHQAAQAARADLDAGPVVTHAVVESTAPPVETPHAHAVRRASEGGPAPNAAETADTCWKEVQRQQIIDHANELLRFCAIKNVVTSIRQCTSSFFVLLYQRIFDCTISGIDRAPNTPEKKLQNVSLVLEELRKRNYNLHNISVEEVVRLNEDHISRLVLVFVQIASAMYAEQQRRAAAETTAEATTTPALSPTRGGYYTVAEITPPPAIVPSALSSTALNPGGHPHRGVDAVAAELGHPYHYPTATPSAPRAESGVHDDAVHDGAVYAVGLSPSEYARRHPTHHHYHPHHHVLVGSEGRDYYHNAPHDPGRVGERSYSVEDGGTEITSGYEDGDDAMERARSSVIPTDVLVKNWYRTLVFPPASPDSQPRHAPVPVRPTTPSHPATSASATTTRRTRSMSEVEVKDGGRTPMGGDAGAVTRAPEKPTAGSARRVEPRPQRRPSSDWSRPRPRGSLVDDVHDLQRRQRSLVEALQQGKSRTTTVQPEHARVTPVQLRRSRQPTAEPCEASSYTTPRPAPSSAAPHPTPPRLHRPRALVAEAPLTRVESRLLASHPQRQIDAEVRDRKIERLRAARFLGDAQSHLRRRMRQQYDESMAVMREQLRHRLAIATQSKHDHMRRMRDENDKYRQAYATLMQAAVNDVRVSTHMMSRHTMHLAEYYAASLEESRRMCRYLEKEQERRNKADLLHYAQSVSAWQQQVLV